MNNVAEKIVNQEELNHIVQLKNQVDQVYRTQQVFGLSLETLELTRRFNNKFVSEDHLSEMDEHEFNQLMAVSDHLERNLMQELK